MNIYNVKAKDGRRVVLPGVGGTSMVVPTQYEAQFPESLELIRERDLHGDLEVCELVVAQPEQPELFNSAIAKKGK